MKRLFCILTAILLCLFAVTSASAATKHIKDVTFSVDDGFKVHTEDDLLASSNVDGLIFAVLSEDGKHQIQARCTTSEFSTNLNSFYGLDEELIAPVGETLFPEGYETATINSLIYLKNTSHSDTGYTSVYITVNDGKLYTFTYFGTDATKMGEFMTTVKLPNSTSNKGANLSVIILICIFIIVDIIFVMFLVVSFVKDYKHHKMETSENIVSQYIKIKRRKF